MIFLVCVLSFEIFGNAKRNGEGMTLPVRIYPKIGMILKFPVLSIQKYLVEKFRAFQPANSNVVAQKGGKKLRMKLQHAGEVRYDSKKRVTKEPVYQGLLLECSNNEQFLNFKKLSS